MKLFKNLNKRDWLMILLVAITVMGDVYFELKMPEFTAALTATAQAGRAVMSDVMYNGLRMLGCVFASTICNMITFVLVSLVANNFERNLRKLVFNKVIAYSDNEINRFSVASLITRTTNDITQTNMFLGMGLQLLFKAPLMAGLAIVKISNADLKWTTATLICVVLIVMTVVVTAVICIPRFQLIQKLTDRLNNLSRENISGVRVIRAFNAEKYQAEKFAGVNNDIYRNNVFTGRVTGLIGPVMTISMNCLTMAIYWIGALIINSISGSDALAQRAVTVGNMTAFTSYAMQVIMSFMLLSMTFLILPRVIVSMNRINEVLETEISLTDGEGKKSSVRGKIEFRDVDFSYGGDEHDVLNDITFTAEQGETVAIIGATGSGKTTLVDLIPRFYDADKGKVLIDDIDVRDYELKTLRDKISFAFQKAALFKGTVLDNITYGCTEKDEERVHKALHIAQVDFIDDLNFEISQGATNLSGGQKQRLSIARALYKQSEIIIFDDTFSALDYKTDMLVRKGIAENYKDVTVLIVAQRIGTIKNADRIIVLDEGRIVGIGKHQELLKDCPVYAEIALSQLSEEEL
ncbi:MAG: ABC transporter ATP-binding protein [Erysipelotrichaceae bacterium]|nr:ABC transporter ATP-binding protein [Erysipelotrichaceae bacterium]